MKQVCHETKKIKDLTVIENSQNQDKYFFVGKVDKSNKNEDSWFTINNVNVKIKLDTGAMYNILSTAHLKHNSIIKNTY